MSATLENNAPRLRAAIRRTLGRIGPDVLEPTARFAKTRVNAAATGQHMRDAKGEGPRRKGDGGPLRIVTGDYVQRLTGRRSGITSSIETTGDSTTFKRVADFEKVPQAYNEKGAANDNAFGKGIKTVTPARPTQQPALESEMPRIEKYAGNRLRKVLKEELAAGSGGAA